MTRNSVCSFRSLLDNIADFCFSVLMTDPAVAYTPDEDYGPYHRGVEQDIWMKMPNGSDSLGLVWPGVTVYPDWFHPGIQE